MLDLTIVSKEYICYNFACSLLSTINLLEVSGADLGLFG